MNIFLSNVTYLLGVKKHSWYWLSKQTGIPQSTLSYFRSKCAKDITLSSAIKIAEVLNVSLDVLVHKDLKTDG